MSYQVLARKWRPKTFREMVGQAHVLRALINALDHNRLHHAYLFTGTRGVGKTTIARILAKCLNCEAGVSSEPCGTCSSCLEIAEGRSVDLLEIDAASRTKVEDTRELLDNVQYAPTRSRFKIYLIDEVHMLSTHSFNALLKTLEEPPPHVKFLLATTDPQKLPATVLSRCLQFNLKSMPPEQIVGHLETVLGQEMVSFEEPALWLLARAASGSMRDALSLTDQAIAFGAGKVDETEVRSMLGSVDLDHVYELLEALSRDEPATVLEIVHRMAEFAPDFESSLDEFLSLLHRVTTAQIVPEAIDNSWGDAATVARLARAITAEDAQLFYQIALNGKRDLALSPDPRIGFEMVLLRMIAFRPTAVLDDGLRQDAVLLDVPAAAAEVSAPAKKPHESPPTEAGVPSKDDEHGASGRSDSHAPDVQGDSEFKSLTTETWHEVLELLGLTGIVYNIASHCEFINARDNTLHFVLDDAHSAIFNNSHTERLGAALASHFGQRLSASVVAGTVRSETPAMRMARLAHLRREEAIDAIEADPQVQALIARFDGRLDRSSILPIDA